MFTYDGKITENGSLVDVYTVRYYDSGGTPQYVTIDTELPSGGGYYDHPVNNVLWVALAEKAYAQANGVGYVTSGQTGVNSYAALAGGDAAWALRAITGKSASNFSINPSNVAGAWNAGQLVVLCTSNPASPYIVGNHCYALVNYNPSSSTPFQFFNPWGTDSSGWAPNTDQTKYGLYSATSWFLSMNFTSQSIGNGAAPGQPDGRHDGSSRPGVDPLLSESRPDGRHAGSPWLRVDPLLSESQPDSHAQAHRMHAGSPRLWVDPLLIESLLDLRAKSHRE
jgi:hypothetical protein